MALRALQITLQDALLGGSEEARNAAHAAILDVPPLRPEARLDVYANAYRWRLIEALADTYAMLARALGEEDFAELGRRYIAAHPSVHRSIRWYGAELAEFLAHTEPYREHPVLAELARFEWTLAAVFDARDAQPIERAALLAIAPEGWAGLRVEFHPSIARLDLAWNTVAVWRALGAEAEPPEPQPLEEPVPWLLWRQSLKNYFRSLDAAELRALETARGGATFAEVCAALSPMLSDEEIPLKAATYIGTWAESGLLVGLTLDG
jgi:hypothetical protein